MYLAERKLKNTSDTHHAVIPACAGITAAVFVSWPPINFETGCNIDTAWVHLRL